MDRISFVLLVLGVCAAHLVSATVAASEPETPLRHSDVVFMYDNESLYEAYGCTVLGWAGQADAAHIERGHAKGVRWFCSSIGFRTEGARFVDFTPDYLEAACQNFAGEPFLVPWLWDHKHKGVPAWWYCTNSPLYRKYLDSRLAQVMKAGPDGLHIDDYSGTVGAVNWLSACFCKSCLAGFREYLEKQVPRPKLAELGIADLSQFDYRKYLLDRGLTPEDYKKRRAGLPLAGEFLDFQVKADTAFLCEFRQRGEQLRGRPISLCVNSGLGDPTSLAIAPQVSFFCCEIPHGAEKDGTYKHPVYIYKLAAGLNRPVTSTASGQDWAYVSQHQKPGLVRTWIALSYALGQNFMAPQRQWCYTKEKGTHWYQGPTEEYAYVYQFVRRNTQRLDDYQAVAPVAVVYDNAARRAGKGNIEPICSALAEANIPFEIVVAGDDWLPDYRLSAQHLFDYRAVVIDKDLRLDDGQRRTLDDVRDKGRLVVWPDRAALDRLAPAPVTLAGTDAVMAVPRAVPGDRDRPLVVHLLNRRYDQEKDAVISQRDFTLRLSHDLVRQPLSKATLFTPQREPLALDVTSDTKGVAVQVPKLDFWGILELSR